ncbi:MAG: RCKP-type rubredoxin-like domain-containing protein [Thermodesulfobacteriota bacterium]
MALWKCTKCGYSKETRCRPKACPECEGKEFEKAE